MIRRSVLGLVVLAAIQGCGGSGSAGPKEPTTTFLAFKSSPGEWIGQGLSYHYDLGDGTWEATYDFASPAHQLMIRLTGPGNTYWWELHLAARQGQDLVPGTYELATRWPFQAATEPGLDFFGTGRGCNTLTGRFVIKSLTLGAGNLVERLHATFLVHCDGGTPALKGEVALVPGA